MKKLMIICAAAALMLISTSVSWAVPAVTPPPDGLCDWWNVKCIWYAYAWWEDDLSAPYTYDTHPPDDAGHWASNFLENTNFTAGVAAQTNVWLNLKNVYEPDLKKEIFIYIEGTTNSGSAPTGTLYTYAPTGLPKPVFTGGIGGINNGDGTWQYLVSGEIIPQPSSQYLTVTVPGLLKVTNIWVGENCIPEPTTICLLGLGALGLLRKRRK